MPFETFTRQRRSGRQPFVTIQKKGVISLNKAAFEELDSPESVELLYDREARLVGLRKVDSSVEHAYAVRAPVEGHATFLLSGAAFVSYYEIDTSKSVRRAARRDGDMLVVDLNDPGVESASEQAEDSDPRLESPIDQGASFDPGVQPGL